MATDIKPLLENSHDVFSTQDIGISESESNCHKYRITYSHPCTIEGVNSTTLYLDAQFLRPNYNRVIEEKENRNGENLRILSRITPVLRLEFITNDAYFEILNQIGLHDEILISPINPDGPDFEVESGSWEVEPLGAEDEDTYQCRISFRVKDTTLVSGICCEDQSIVSFEDPCDPGGEGGGPPIEDPCADFEVSISYDGNSLTADVSGGPGMATTSYIWYLNAGTGVFTQIATSQSLNPVDPGVYRVVVTRGTCQKSADYTFSGECDDYTVELMEKPGPILIANVNRFSTFVWYKDTGSGFVEIPGETTACLVPDETATYKVEATSAGCEGDDEIEVEITVCAHTVAITRDDNVLTAEVTGNTGTPTYQWYADYGDGNGTVIIGGATGSTLAVSVPGCYEVKVTADGCDKYAKLVILDVCVGFNAIISGVAPAAGDTVDLTAEAQNPPGDVNYTWYQSIGGVWQQVGTGAMINLGTTGNVRLVATSGACTSEDQLFFCVDPGALENYESTLGDGVLTAFIITNFILPNPATYTENQINAMLQVYRNGVKMQYSSMPASRTQYSINFADNEIQIDAGFPLKATERLEALLVNTP